MVEDEGTEIVLNYMNSQNRPFNAKQVFENIHGKETGLSSAKVTKILEDLVAQGKMQSKDHNKKNVYWASQNRFEAVDEAGMKELDERVAKLKQEEDDLRAQVGVLESEHKSLVSEPTDGEIDKQLEELEALNKQLAGRLEKIRSNSKAVDSKQKEKLEQQYNLTKTEWRKRKRKFQDISDQIEENIEAKKWKKMKVEIGVETDEDVGMKIDEDQTSKFKAKKWYYWGFLALWTHLCLFLSCTGPSVNDHVFVWLLNTHKSSK